MAGMLKPPHLCVQRRDGSTALVNVGGPQIKRPELCYWVPHARSSEAWERFEDAVAENIHADPCIVPCARHCIMKIHGTRDYSWPSVEKLSLFYCNSSVLLLIHNVFAPIARVLTKRPVDGCADKTDVCPQFDLIRSMVRRSPQRGFDLPKSTLAALAVQC